MSLRKVTSNCVTSSWKTLLYKKHTKIHDLSEHKIPAACVCQGQITIGWKTKTSLERYNCGATGSGMDKDSKGQRKLENSGGGLLPAVIRKLKLKSGGKGLRSLLLLYSGINSKV